MGDPEVSRNRLIPPFLRSEVFWVLLAFVLRAAFSLFLGERLYQADELGYSEAAKSIARFGFYGVGAEHTIGAPGASFLFSIFIFLKTGLPGARLGQAALSAATAWLLGRLTRAAAGSERAGLFALALASIYPFFVYYSGMLMSETLYLAAVAGGLWALVASIKEEGRRAELAAAAGGVWALAGLTRTEGVPIALALWGALAVLCLMKRYTWKSLALASLCWALPLFGWAARNKAHSGKLTLDLHGGMTLLHGTQLYDIDQDDTAFSQQAFKLSPLYRDGRKLGEAERDALYFRAGLKFMRENPGTVLRQWVQKAVAFWRLYPRIDKRYPDTATASPNVGASRRMMVLISLMSEPVLILFGFYGAWLLRGRLWTLFPLYWLVVATFGVHVIVVSQMRYRLPVMLVMILFAGAAADRRLPRFK